MMDLVLTTTVKEVARYLKFKKWTLALSLQLLWSKLFLMRGFLSFKSSLARPYHFSAELRHGVGRGRFLIHISSLNVYLLSLCERREVTRNPGSISFLS